MSRWAAQGDPNSLREEPAAEIPKGKAWREWLWIGASVFIVVAAIVVAMAGCVAVQPGADKISVTAEALRCRL